MIQCFWVASRYIRISRFNLDQHQPFISTHQHPITGRTDQLSPWLRRQGYSTRAWHKDALMGCVCGHTAIGRDVSDVSLCRQGCPSWGIQLFSACYHALTQRCSGKKQTFCEVTCSTHHNSWLSHQGGCTCWFGIFKAIQAKVWNTWFTWWNCLLFLFRRSTN